MIADSIYSLCADPRTYSDAQLEHERREIAARKLAIRQATDWRPILFEMERIGEVWQYDAEGELRVKPKWLAPVNWQHRDVIAATRADGRRMDELTAEMVRRMDRGPRSRQTPR